MERLLRRSHATGLRWALLSLAGLSFAAACSDDAAPGSGSNTAGGEGGESNAATAGTAGKATTAGTTNGGSAGTAGTAGTSTAAGEAGMGGEPHVATLGETCTACGATECVDTLKSCSDSTECTAWLGCVTACDSSDCVTACDNTYVAAARVYTGVYACLCTSCKDDCTGADACGKKTCVDDNPLALMPTAPANLAETGLYATLDDGAGGGGGAGGAGSVELAMPIEIASYVRGFVPKYPLWADGATKDRYVYIPKCATIDTTDPDHWKFPIGTTFWKTFTVEGAKFETRMLHRFGAGALDWTYAAYQWNSSVGAAVDDPTLATLAPDTGVLNPSPLKHDIPSIGQCKQCHNGLEEKVLSFQAIQLSHPATGTDLAIDKLNQLGMLSKPAPAGGYQVPGTAVQTAALGYMHGNCGGCHSDKTPLPAASPQLLRLSVLQTTYATTDAVKTTVGVTVVSANAAITGKKRIAPMDAANSAILIRMGVRTSDMVPAHAGLQMPPIGTKVIDTDGGMKVVTDWVNSIAP